MAYIGRDISNLSDRVKLDAITTSATATFNLTLNSVAYVPSSAESLTVSLNGVIQAPQSSYTVSNATIVFASNLASSDVIDFILAERAITLTTVGSGSVGTSQLVDDAVTSAKVNLTDELHINSTASGNTLKGLLKLETDGTSDGSGITIDTRTAHSIGQIDFLDGTGSFDGSYVFKLAQGSALATPSEVARINADKQILVGTFASNGATMGGRFDGGNGNIFLSNTQTGSWSNLKFHNPNGVVGSIDTSGSNTAYNTSSDYRLKENVSYSFDATSRLKQLKPARFNFKTDADTTVDGFLAHEVSSIVPEAITGEKDGTEIYLDDNGDEQTKPLYQGIDQSKLVPLLVKTIQELEARITELENA